MKTDLVRIGNSRGIRIPKPIIEECGFGGTVELRVESNRLVVSPQRSARQGWAEAFRAAGSATGDKLLLDPLPPGKFDREDWEW
jgi:antitoxin MazE